MTSNLEPNSLDGPRQVIDLALSCGRRFQSAQTGFVHFCYEDQDQPYYETVPTIDNWLFVLTLLRTKSRDLTREAISLLERLVCYEKDGNIPRYLHELPFCRDRYHAFHLLAILYRIIALHERLLPAELRTRIRWLMQRTLEYSLELYGDRGAPYHLSVKLGAGAVALGRLTENQEWVSRGERVLDACLREGVTESWFAPDHLGDLAIALGMVFEDFPNSAWSRLWTHLHDTWSRATCSYVGPACRQRQMREEPQVTVHDLLMGYLGGAYSYRVQQPHPVQLQGSLIYPFSQLLPELVPFHVAGGTLRGCPWRVVHGPGFAYGVLDQERAPERSKQYCIVPMQVHWGDSTRVHTLCLQGGNVRRLRFVEEEWSHPEHFSLRLEVAGEEGKDEDLLLYLDRHESLKKMVEGKSATTFELGEEVLFCDLTLRLGLHVTCLDGSAQYQGHLRPGNRPGQMALKGADRFAVYDEELVVRAVNRKEPQELLLNIDLSS